MTGCLPRFDDVGYPSDALCNAERRVGPAHVSPDPTGMHRQHCDGSVSYIRRDKAAGTSSIPPETFSATEPICEDMKASAPPSFMAERSSGMEPSSLCRFCRDCIIATRGYNFREGQEVNLTSRDRAAPTVETGKGLLIT